MYFRRSTPKYTQSTPEVHPKYIIHIPLISRPILKIFDEKVYFVYFFEQIIFSLCIIALSKALPLCVKPHNILNPK